MAMSDKSAANLITEVRTLINEENAVLFSDTDITAGLDFAINEMSKSMLFGGTSTSQQLSTGTQYYTYTSNLPRPEAIIYYGASETAPEDTAGTAKTLIKTHPRQMAQNADRSTDGPPVEWWFADEKIWVYPAPSASENNHYLIILGWSYDAAYSTDVPDYLQEYTIWYALSKCFEKKKNYAAAQQYMAIFNSFIMFHRLDNFYPKPIDSKDMMKIQDRTVTQESR